MKYLADVDGLTFPVEILDENHVRFGDQVIEVDLSAISGQPLYSLLINGESYEGYVYPGEDRGWQVILRGNSYVVQVEDEREKRLNVRKFPADVRMKEFVLKAPMPGLIIDVPVEDEGVVEQGDILVVLESMKMQNELKSPVSGKVSSVKVKKGDSVDLKQHLLNVTKSEER